MPDTLRAVFTANDRMSTHARASVNFRDADNVTHRPDLVDLIDLVG